MPKTKTIAGMATIYSRKETLPMVVANILPQVDELHIYLNDYGVVPQYMKQLQNIVPHLHPAGDLGDAGKFYTVHQHQGYYLSLDDDLIYPKDYVERLIAKIEQYKRQAVISYHGRNLKAGPISSYYRRSARNLYRCLSTIKEDQRVQIGGTGVMGFHTSLLQLHIKDFPVPNMADVWMGKKCQDNNYPIYVAAHRKGWLQHAPINMSQTIARNMTRNHKKVTEIVNSISWKQL